MVWLLNQEITEGLSEKNTIFTALLSTDEAIPHLDARSRCVHGYDCLWSDFTTHPDADGGYTTWMHVSSCITVASLISHLPRHFLLCCLHLTSLSFTFIFLFLFVSFYHQLFIMLISVAYALCIVLAPSLPRCINNMCTQSSVFVLKFGDVKNALKMPLLYLEMLRPNA